MNRVEVKDRPRVVREKREERKTSNSAVRQQPSERNGTTSEAPPGAVLLPPRCVAYPPAVLGTCPVESQPHERSLPLPTGRAVPVEPRLNGRDTVRAIRVRRAVRAGVACVGRRGSRHRRVRAETARNAACRTRRRSTDGDVGRCAVLLLRLR